MAQPDPITRDSVCFIQDGARLHYLMPIGLERGGMLNRMYCDWYSKGLLKSLLNAATKLSSKISIKRAAERCSSELPSSKIKHFPLKAIQQKKQLQNFPTREAFYEWESRANAELILRSGFNNAKLLYGFARNIHPHLLREARKTGMKTMVDQIIAPSVIEEKEYGRQQSEWPGWENSGKFDYQIVADLETQSWKDIDHITCGSEYVKNCLISIGIDRDKISVLPYAPNCQIIHVDRPIKSKPIVGFTGSIGLRKGAPYFAEVAARCPEAEFQMIGGTSLNETGLNLLRRHVNYLGPVPRSEIVDRLKQFDLYLFPSTCEGCASSVMEAMASGLPVIASPNSGTIIRDGIDGFIVPFDDINTMTQRVQQLLADPNLRHTIGESARQRVQAYNYDWYVDSLQKLMHRILA